MMSKRHQELQLERIVAIRQAWSFINIFSVSRIRVERFIEHLELKGFKIVKIESK